MVKCGVLFEVRTEFLNIIRMSFGFKSSALRANVELIPPIPRYTACLSCSPPNINIKISPSVASPHTKIKISPYAVLPRFSL
jgi:hypothetical protein